MKKTLLFAAAMTLLSCGGKTTDTTSDDDSSVTGFVQSSVGAVSDALSQDTVAIFSQDPSAQESTRQQLVSEEQVSEQQVATNNSGALLPRAACTSTSFGACSSSVKSRSFGGCSRTGSSGDTVTVFGSASLTFSDSGCSMATNGNFFTRTVSNHYVTLSSGYKILVFTSAGVVDATTISSSDLTTWDGLSKSGGTKVTKNSNAMNVLIQGVHRWGLRSTGVVGFKHTMYTDSSGITVTGSGTSGSPYTVSGTVTVAHNRANVNVSTLYNNVGYVPSSCCYPTSGTMTYQLGTATARTITFNSTCGSITVDSVAATLPACGS